MPPTDPTTYDWNDVERLNRADEYLWAAWQIIDAESKKIQHYKHTGKLAKLTARVWLLRQFLNTVKDDLQEIVE